MKQCISSTLFAIVLLFAFTATGFASDGGPQPSLCAEKDVLCKELETLVRNEQYDTAVGRIDPNEAYSETTRQYIGKAYLGIASAESNTPAQEEQYCRKALAYGAVQAYMGLYFISVQESPEAALGYLRQYVATKPGDSVPYVILGEAELDKGHYKEADSYLRESKKVARARSARVDFMLFQANYMLGNFADASQMLEAALSGGQLDKQMRSLSADSRFSGIASHPEFKKFPQFASRS
jgi:tetratricopeptide (TPR) repeat protein